MIHWSIVVGAIFVLVGVASPAATAGPVIATLDATRHGSAALVDGNQTDQARASLLANFPAATVWTAPEWTAGFLSGVQIAIVHNARNSGSVIDPLTAAEQTAIYDFVLGGGRALIVGDGFHPASANNVVASFGATIDGPETGRTSSTVSNPAAHPLTNGPFGLVDTVEHYYPGWFTGLPATASPLIYLDDNNLPVFAVIEAGALGPTSGRVVLMTDASSFADDGDGENGSFTSSETLFLNTISYLAAPEPSTGVLLATASVGLLSLIRRRRGRARWSRHPGSPPHARLHPPPKSIYRSCIPSPVAGGKGRF